MRRTTHCLLGILGVWLGGALVQAKTINPVSVNLHTEAQAVLDGETVDDVFPDEIGGAVYGSFFSGAIADILSDFGEEAVGFAELHATVAPDEVSVKLDWGFTISTLGEVSSSSASGQVVFHVVREVLFDLQLDFTSEFGSFDVVLQHDGADVWAERGTDGDAPFPAHINEQRFLGPGLYTLALEGETLPAAGTAGENTMQFTLTPVPEPGTAAMLGSVACLLIWPGRSRAAGRGAMSG